MQEIDVRDLAALGDDAVILDVREPDELVSARLANAIPIPMSGFLDALEQIPDVGTLYVLCHSGGRSARVTAYLEQSGRDAVNVTGGITAWAEAGLPIVSGPLND